MESHPEATSEQEAMKKPMRGLAEALDTDVIKGISVEILVDSGMPEPRAREIFGYLEKNGAIGEEISAEEGHVVDRDILQKLIEGAPSTGEEEKIPDVQTTIGEARKEVDQEIKDGRAAAERAGAVDPTSQESLGDAEDQLKKTVERKSTIYATREAFVEESDRMRHEKLIADIYFSPEFAPRDRDDLFALGPEKIRELLNNLRERLRAAPAKLGEFSVEIFSDERLALAPDQKVLELGIYALGKNALLETAGKLEHATSNIAAEQQERERIAHSEENFNREQKALEAKVGGFTILPILKLGSIEAGAVITFFDKLNFALNLSDADIARELLSRKISVFVIDGSEVSITPHNITIGIDALKGSALQETARKIRGKIAPPAAPTPQPVAPRVAAPAQSAAVPPQQPPSAAPQPEPKAPAAGEIVPPPPSVVVAPPPAESHPAESPAERMERWEAIFHKIVVSNFAKTWAASKKDSSEESLFQKLDELITLLTADLEILPALAKYNLLVSIEKTNLVTKGTASIGPTIRVSASGLMEDPAATADFFIGKIRELEGITPGRAAGEAAPVTPPGAPPATPPTPEPLPTAEKTPAEKLAGLIAEWERATKSPSAMEFLRNLATAPHEQWPSFLAQAAGMVHRGRLWPYEFEQISEIIGEGVTMEQLVERNRAAAATTTEEFGARHPAEKESRDPVRVFMRDVMHLSEEEIHNINFGYRVIVRQDANGSGENVTCSNYHDFLREREKISPEDRARLDGLTWGTAASGFSKVAFLAANFWERLGDDGDLAEYRDGFHDLLYGVVHGEFAPDDFAAWAEAAGKRSSAAATGRRTDAGRGTPETLDTVMSRLTAYTQFDVGVGTKSATLEADTNVLLRLERDVYPSVIRLVKPRSHIRLMVSETNRFMPEGAGLYINKESSSQEIIDQIREFLRNNPQFAETEIADEREPMNLDEARNAYATAYAQYLRQNARQRVSTYDIDGDTSGVETARARYDAALKNAAVELRQKEHDRVLVPGSEWTPEDATDSANRIIFESLVIQEEKTLAKLRIGEIPPKEQGVMKTMWLAYARMPRWQKIAISTAIGTTVAAATGTVGGIGILLYAGKKILVPLVSGGVGAATTSAMEAYDQTRGKAGTKEYQLDELLEQRQDDISQNLDDMRQEYKAILDHQADREKKRMWLKVGLAALAGAGTAFGAGMLQHHFSAAPHDTGTPGSAPKTVTPERVVPTDRPSPFPNPTEHKAVPPVATPSPNQTTLTEAPPGERAIVEPTETPTVPPTEPTPTLEMPPAHSPVIIPQNDNVDRILRSLRPSQDATPQGAAPDIYNLPTVNRLHDGLMRGPLGFIPNNHVEPVPSELHHTLDSIPGRHVEPVPSEMHNTLDLRTTPRVPAPPKLPQFFDDQGRNIPLKIPDHRNAVLPFPVREPGSLPFTASTGAHEIVGQSELGNALPPETVQNSIAVWDGKDLIQAARIAHQVEDVSRLSPVDRSLLVSSLAQKVGDKNWSMHMNMVDPEEVSRRVKDYLVAYPEAKNLGFHNYDEYAGVKNVTVGKLIDQMPPDNSLPDALRHSFFHRGAHIEEFRNGRIHRVPLKVEHARLGMALEFAKDNEGLKAMTVGEILSQYNGNIEGQLSSILQRMGAILNRGR